MKASTQLLLALCIASGATAQKVNYEMIEDDPKFNGLTIAPFTGVNYSFGQTFAMNIGMEVWVRKLPVHLHGYIDRWYRCSSCFRHSSPPNGCASETRLLAHSCAQTWDLGIE